MTTATIKATRSNVMKSAWELVKLAGYTMSNALKEAWAKIKNMGQKQNEVEKLISLISGKKFNGKVYGVKQFSIYLDSEKVEITSEQASILRKIEDCSMQLGHGISYSWYTSRGERKDVAFKNPDGFRETFVPMVARLELINNTQLEVLASNEIEGTQYEICRVTIYSQVQYWLSSGKKSEKVEESNAQSLIQELQETK